MKKIDPQLLELSTDEKQLFDEVAKEFFNVEITDPIEYQELIAEVNKIKKKNTKSRVGVEVNKLVSKLIYKKVKFAKKLKYFLIVPTVSLYISNSTVYNEKFFEEVKNMNENYFIQYINLVAMFTLTRNTRERSEIKKDLELMDKGLNKLASQKEASAYTK